MPQTLARLVEAALHLLGAVLFRVRRTIATAAQSGHEPAHQIDKKGKPRAQRLLLQRV